MAEFRQWWQCNREAYEAVLFDIDGTLMSAGTCLPGANTFLDHLRETGFPFCLLTNDGDHSVEEKSAMLCKAGLHILPEDIISSAMPLKDFAAENQYTGQPFFVLGSLGCPCYAERAGLIPCRDPEKIDDCAGVIVGEGAYDWHGHLTSVFNFFIRHPERPLVVPNPDAYWPGHRKGEYGIGAGAHARFICGLLAEMGILLEPVYLGKPHGRIYDYAVKSLCERYRFTHPPEPHRIVMVGDSLASDIRGANRSGLTSVLILSGITTATQAEAASADLRPSLTFSSLG